MLTNHRSKLIYPSGLSDLATIEYVSALVGDEHVRSDLDEPKPPARTGSAPDAVPRPPCRSCTPNVLRQMRDRRRPPSPRRAPAGMAAGEVASTSSPTTPSPVSGSVHALIGQNPRCERTSMTEHEQVRQLEGRLWKAADQLRANSSLAASQYSMPVLGLIFLRYADVRFTQVERELAGKATGRREIGKADYQARGVMYVPDDGPVRLPAAAPRGQRHRARR